MKQPRRECARGVALFQHVVRRLRMLHATHPEIAMFCAHNPHEHRESAGEDGLRGIYPAGRRAYGITVP